MNQEPDEVGYEAFLAATAEAYEAYETDVAAAAKAYYDVARNQ